MALFKKDRNTNIEEPEIGMEPEEEIWEEEAPRHKRREKKKSGHAVRFAVILLAAALLVGLWMGRDSMAAARLGDWFHTRLVGIGTGDGYPASIIGSKVLPTNLRSSEGMAVMLSDTSLSVLNPTAKVMMSRQHSFSAPRMCISAGQYLVYNIGGTGYRIETVSETKLQGQANGNIQCAAFSPGGRFAFGTQSEGNASRLTVYLASGEVQYTYSFYDAYITAVALSRDGSRGVVSAVSTDHGELCSTLYLFDFSKEEPVASFVSEDNLVAFLHWAPGGKIVAAGDQAVVYGNMTALEKNPAAGMETREYRGAELTAYAAMQDTVCAALYDGSASVLLCMDGENKPAEVAVSGKIDSVSVYGGHTAVLHEGIITVLDSVTGRVLVEDEVGRDANAVSLSSESTAYILGVSEIKRMDFNIADTTSQS